MKGNKKTNTYSAVFGFAVFLVAFVICISMFLPRNVGNIFEISSTPQSTYEIDDLTEQIGCDVSQDGTYKVSSGDPQLIFKVDNSVKIAFIRLNLIPKNEQNVAVEIYTAYENGGFSAERRYVSTTFSNKHYAVFDIPEDNYSFLRIDINDEDIVFENIEIFDEEPIRVPYKPDYSFFDYLITVVLPIVLGLSAYLLNKKIGFVERFCKSISKNKFKIITIFIFSVVAILLSVLIELIIGVITKDVLFNIYRWIFIAGIAELIVAFVFGFKCLKEKPENLFLPIVFILGAVMLFGSPIKHISWDLDSHYPWAVQASYPGTTYVTAAYNNVYYATSYSAWGENCDLKTDLEHLNDSEKILVTEMESTFSIAHLPSGIFIAVSRLFGANFAVKYNMGRFANLILYSVICFFAIKKIKSGKMILSVICLFPTNLFLATNYSYDWWVTCFTILGTSYFVSELQEPEKPISIKDTVIMALGFAIGALPKLVYIIMMGMMVFMRKNNWSAKDKKRYYGILISVFAVVFVMFALKSMSSIGGSGDIRGGAVNPTEQLKGILSAPFNYAKLLFKFLIKYLSIDGMKYYISFFAYLGMGSLYMIPITLIAFTALTDTSEKVSFKIPLYMKVLSVVLFVGMSAVVATSLYVVFTPLGHSTVNGCQPRYIVPMLAPLLLLLTGSRVNLVKNKAVYNGCVLSLMTFTVLAETYSLIITKMI